MPDTGEAVAEPVRVMHLVHSFGYGGMEVGVAKLANAIDPSIVSTSICSCRPSDSLKERLRPEVRLFEFDRRPGHDVRLIPQLYNLLRQERPTVLHTHGWATACEGLLAARLARVPLVVHGEHGTLETRRRNVLVQRWVWGQASRVLSVSSRLSERMAREIGFPTDRIQVIRNGVDTNRFNPGRRPAARATFGLGADQVVLGTAGRLVPVKDQATLLRAWAILRSRGHAFTGLVAGNGPLEFQLTRLARSLGLDNVHFLGNRPDVEQVLATMDVFILSSEAEGLSNTIQEAMATGLPVVATQVGGADELVVEDETGLLVPAKNPEVLANAIERLMADTSLRVRMAEAGRRRATQVMALARMVREYVQVYQELAATTASRSAARVSG